MLDPAETQRSISIVVASGHASPEPGSMPDKARFIAKPFSAELVHAHLQEILPDGQKPEPLKRFMTASPTNGARRPL